MRALKQRLGYSLQTINVAINLLEREGLLVRKHGSGLYVLKKDTARHIAYCRTNFPNVNRQLLENGLRDACLRRGWILTTHEFQTEHPDMLLDHEVKGDGIVLMPELVSFGYGIAKVVMASKIPLVIVGVDARPLGMDCVNDDDPATLRIIFGKLTSLGHHRIAFLMTEPHCREIDQKATDFFEIANEFRLEDCMLIDCETVSGQASGLSAYRTMQKFLTDHPGKLPFTALISCSSPGSLTAMRALHEKGWHVPEDCSIVSMQEDPIAPYSIPSMSEMKSDYPSIGEKCIALLENRVLGKSGDVQYVKLPHELFWRESVGRAPRAGNGKKK